MMDVATTMGTEAIVEVHTPAVRIFPVVGLTDGWLDGWIG